MRILAVLRLVPGADRDHLVSLLDDEVTHLWNLYVDGHVAGVHMTDDPGVVVLDLDTASLDEARAAVDSLPLLAEGLMTAELHELRPFRNWQRLFRER